MKFSKARIYKVHSRETKKTIMSNLGSSLMLNQRAKLKIKEDSIGMPLL